MLSDLSGFIFSYNIYLEVWMGGKIMQMVDRVHQILTEYLKPGDRAVDATVGNGWDTLKLCELVGDTGKV